MNLKNKFGKSFILSLCLTLATGMIFTSCSKDDPLPTVNVEVLTAAPWNFVSAAPSGTVNDALLKTAYDAAYADATFTFNADGTVVYSSSGITIGTGTWSLTTDKTGLILTIPNTLLNNTTVTVSTLSASSFIFVAPEVIGKTTYTFSV